MLKYFFVLFLGFLFFSVLIEISYANLPKDVNERGNDHGVLWRAYLLKEGDTPESLFGKYASQAMRFNRLAKKFWKAGVIIKKPENPSLLKTWTPMPLEYEFCSKKGICLSKLKKAIVIDLKKQYLGVYANGKLRKLEKKELKESDFTYISFPVSTGTEALECKDSKTKQPINCLTPPGLFQIKSKAYKVFSWRYKVWMYYAMSIGHERYIHKGDLPGYPASHGCIRMFREDARYLWKHTPEGTYVFIVSSTE